MSRIAVVGEAVVDLHHRPGAGARSTHTYTAHPGGSPLNVAVGLGRLGVPTAFLGRFSTDAFGAILRRHALQSDVDLSCAASDTRPSTTAVFDLDDEGAARYAFHLDGAADWHWSREELERVPPEVAAVHFGSLASWRAPGCGPILEAMRRLREHGVLIGYDPNVRAELFPSEGVGLARVEAAVAASDLVKASVEDLGLLYPGVEPQEIAARWLTLGPSAVVVTLGARGAELHAARDSEPILVVGRAAPVEVADTVGAGDAFTAALLAELADRDLLSRAGLAALLGGDAGAGALRDVLDLACTYAAATCTREGADPPWRSEFPALRGQPTGPRADSSCSA